MTDEILTGIKPDVPDGPAKIEVPPAPDEPKVEQADETDDEADG